MESEKEPASDEAATDNEFALIFEYSKNSTPINFDVSSGSNLYNKLPKRAKYRFLQDIPSFSERCPLRVACLKATGPNLTRSDASNANPAVDPAEPENPTDPTDPTELVEPPATPPDEGLGAVDAFKLMVANGSSCCCVCGTVLLHKGFQPSGRGV
jgi:hypothetical protein